MRYDFQCPSCGADTSIRTGSAAAFRMQMPCELCSRDMLVSSDGASVISRCVESGLGGAEDTVRIRIARVG